MIPFSLRASARPGGSHADLGALLAHAMDAGPAHQFPFLDAVDACVCVFDEAGRVLYRNWSDRGLALDDRQRAQLSDHASRTAKELFRRAASEDRTLPRVHSGVPSGNGHPVEVDSRRFRLCASLVEGQHPGQTRVAVVTVHPDEPGLTSDDPRRRILEAALPHGLTEREAEVAALVSARRTNREIAVTLGISVHTVRHHVESILVKLDVHSRRQVGRALGISPETESPSSR